MPHRLGNDECPTNAPPMTKEKPRAATPAVVFVSSLVGHWWGIGGAFVIKPVIPPGGFGVKCQFCDNPATVHLTELANKRKREVHLCEGCARKHNLLSEQPAAPQIDLKALLGLLVGPPADP